MGLSASWPEVVRCSASFALVPKLYLLKLLLLFSRGPLEQIWVLLKAPLWWRECKGADVAADNSLGDDLCANRGGISNSCVSGDLRFLESTSLAKGLRSGSAVSQCFSYVLRNSSG